MKKNKKYSIVVLIIPCIALLTMGLVFFNKWSTNETILLPMILIFFMSISIVSYLWKQETKQTFFKLQYKNRLVSQQSKFLVRVIMIGFLFLGIFVFIPKDKAYLVFIPILLGLIIEQFLNPILLVIDSNGIRKTFFWDVSWKNLKSYNIDKENNELTIVTKKDKIILTKGIRSDDMEVIEKSIEDNLV